MQEKKQSKSQSSPQMATDTYGSWFRSYRMGLPIRYPYISWLSFLPINCNFRVSPIGGQSYIAIPTLPSEPTSLCVSLPWNGVCLMCMASCQKLWVGQEWRNQHDWGQTGCWLVRLWWLDGSFDQISSCKWSQPASQVQRGVSMAIDFIRTGPGKIGRENGRDWLVVERLPSTWIRLGVEFRTPKFIEALGSIIPFFEGW